jgi:hypothetical protein
MVSIDRSSISRQTKLITRIRKCLCRPYERRLPWAAAMVALGLLQFSTCTLFAQDAPVIEAKPLPPAVVNAIPVTLDANAKQKLVASGSYSSFFETQPKVDLCPNPVAAADITRTLNAMHPNVGVQAFVAAAMPARLVTRTDRDLVLYNLIHQFRTMEGIPYFSATRGKVRVLFTSSHVVKGLSDRTILADPHYPTIEPTHDLYLEQDDTTFGKNLYLVTVKGLEGGAIELTMSNVEKVWYGIVPALGPGALQLTIVIQPSADGKYLYFYGNVGINASKGFGLEKKVRTSFYNRIIALYNWYTKLADRG